MIAGQFVVLGGPALVLGWRPEGSPLWVLVITLLGAAAFIGLALLLGGTLRAEAVLAVANLLWLVFVLVGGVIVPLDQAPAVLRTIGELTPAGAMSQALRAVLQDGAAPPALSLLVLVGLGRRRLGRAPYGGSDGSDDRPTGAPATAPSRPAVVAPRRRRCACSGPSPGPR